MATQLRVASSNGWPRAPAHGRRLAGALTPQLCGYRPRRAPALRCVASAASSAVQLVSYRQILEETARQGPKPLPRPPREASLTAVLPFLIKLAVGEKELWWRAGGAALCLVASKAAGLMCPLFFKNAVDSFTQLAGTPMQVVLSAATQCLILYGACDVFKHLAKELQAPLFTPLAQAASRRVAYHTFSHVLGLDIKFHLDRRTGRLNRILERGTRSIQLLYRAVFFTFVPTALELFFVCGVLSQAFCPLVGWLVVATFAAYVMWSVAMTQVATEARKRVNQLDNATSAKAVDALLSYEMVTLFNNQALEVGQYNAYLKSYMGAIITTDRLSALLNAGQAAILAAGLAGIMITALHTSGPGVTAGDLVMIQGFLLQLWAPLQFLGWFYRELRSALVDMEEFFAILRTQPGLSEGSRQLPTLPRASPPGRTASAAPVTIDLTTPAADNGIAPSVGGGHAANGNGGPAGSSAVQVPHALGHKDEPSQGQGLRVELRDVHFGYNERKILHGLSLTVEPGRSLALVGPSGSGKSTVLKLLTRLYDVEAGAVEVNGVDVRELTFQSLRGAVAVVPQETILFNDTILQNIRYGQPHASDEEVFAAARMAHLDEAVQRMEKGYNTVVGERGLKLSGGEKQRVAIARAFLRQPRLLICDEATSALDSATEAAIMTSLAELAQGRTSVFVAHRLSTIKGCDAIAVLKEGRLVELSSHEQLMARPGGVYRAMWELQLAEEDEEEGGLSGAGGRRSDDDSGILRARSAVSSLDGGSDSELEDGVEKALAAAATV